MMKVYYNIPHPDAQIALSKSEQALVMLEVDKTSYRGTPKLYDSYIDNGYKRVHPIQLELMSHMNPTKLHMIGLNYAQARKPPPLFHDLSYTHA